VRGELEPQEAIDGGVNTCRPDRRTEQVGRAASSDTSTRKPLNSRWMTKQQLIEKVAAKTELKKSDVEVAVDSVLAVIAESLQANERVDLRGFGSFVVKERKERQGRNPRTGENITIAAKRDASFKPGKELTEKLAQVEAAPTPEEAV
jgi:nucleoid DNA-binding protein